MSHDDRAAGGGSTGAVAGEIVRVQSSGEPERRPPGSGGGGPGGPRAPQPPGRPNRGIFGIILLLSLGLMLLLTMSTVSGSAREVSSWAEFQTMARNGSFEDDSIVVRDRQIEAVKKAGTDAPRMRVYFRIGAESRDFYVAQINEITEGRFKERPSSPWLNMLLGFLPFLILLLVIWFLVARGLRSATGGPGGVLGNFGKSRHRVIVKEKTGVTFSDVAGIDEAKDEVTEIIEFLKNPKKFTRLGGRIPRGVLLVGDPGCGKTLLAKAIAGEADVPFFAISGSDFVEMFVGVGASRVRDLFKQAKEAAPCIIFLDEIDAVGRRRGGGFTTGGHDEREQTLNAILVEMDGFESNDSVIVIAATNRVDVLDPALTRPGRFDRTIRVPLPDVKGRLEILRVHSKKVKLGPDVSMERIARGTPMFSGADLAAIINEAAIGATMHDKDYIEQEDLEEARDKVKFGRARKSRVREEEENKLTAYHEAGHAVLQMLLKDADPLHKVTIIPRGNAGGATFSLPERDRMGASLKWLTATMKVICGGRIAEQRAMNDVSSGASADIAQATAMARAMVLQWGMSQALGFVRYEGVDTREMYQGDREYSEDTARLIDTEVRRIIDEAFRDAERILEANWEKVVAVADALLRYETLSADEVAKLMRGESLDRPTVSDLLRAEARRSAPRKEPAPPPALGPDVPPGGIMPNPA